MKERGLEDGRLCLCSGGGGSEHVEEAATLWVSFQEKFKDSAKGLQGHLACPRAGTEDQLLAFLWCSIIKVICHIENFTSSEYIYLVYLV